MYHCWKLGSKMEILAKASSYHFIYHSFGCCRHADVRRERLAGHGTSEPEGGTGETAENLRVSMDWAKHLFKGSLWEHSACGIIYGLLVLLLTVNLSSHLNNIGRGDWDIFYFYNEVPQITIFQYHQFPLWNPYSCGGMPMLANPQSRFLSPSLIFSSIFGVVVGMKLELIFGLFFGMIGMYLLGRYLKMSWPLVIVPGIIFGLNGSLALHLTEGHFTFLPLIYFPYVFLFFLKSFDKMKYIMVSSLFMGVAFLQGGGYIVIFFFLFLVFFCFFKTFQTRSGRPLGMLLILFLAVFLWAAPKLLPMLELGEHHSRATSLGGYIPLRLMKDIFLSRRQEMGGIAIKEFSNNIGWWEIGAYLGHGVVIIYLLSFVFALDQYPILFSSLLCLVFSLGNFVSFSLWSLLHKFPFFNSMYNSTRMLPVFIFPVSIMCGFVLERIPKNFPWRSIIILTITLFLAIDLLCVGRGIFSDAIRAQTVDRDHQIRFSHPQLRGFGNFKQTYVSQEESRRNGAWSALHDAVLKNEGVINAYEPVSIENKAIANTFNNYKGEYYLTRAGLINLLSWSPNKISFLVDTATNNRLVINQNYDRDWKTQEGLKVESFKGLLSVVLHAGQNKVTFIYQPLSFIIGCLFFMIAILATAIAMNMPRPLRGSGSG